MYVCLQMRGGFNILIKQPKLLCNFNSLGILSEPQCLKKAGNLFLNDQKKRSNEQVELPLSDGILVWCLYFCLR